MSFGRRPPADAGERRVALASPSERSAEIRRIAFSLLARRAHTRFELKKKILRRGFPKEDVEACLGRLAADGYLDDASVAALLAASRSAKGRGRARIAAELGSRGVSRADADTALGGLDPLSEKTALLATLVRKERALPAGLTRQARSKKLFDHLVRRGFAPSAVLEALKRKGDSTDDES